jgi:hypothetical protein
VVASWQQFRHDIDLFNGAADNLPTAVELFGLPPMC